MYVKIFLIECATWIYMVARYILLTDHVIYQVEKKVEFI